MKEYVQKTLSGEKISDEKVYEARTNPEIRRIGNEYMESSFPLDVLGFRGWSGSDILDFLHGR